MTSAVLHITNGDVAADLLRRSQVMGGIVPWRDALHEGPVPEGLPLEELSRVRARYVEEMGWTAPGTARAAFAERDAALLGAAGSVVLWFEHDLYDQLQLLQLLDWFAAHPPPGALDLIEVGEFPGIQKFVGLGQLAPTQLGSLYEHRRPVTNEQLSLAARAWAALRSPDPTGWASLLSDNTFAMPFLQDAVIRLLEEFPWEEDGLPRTERALLEAASATDRTLLHLFRAAQAREERPFMGDAIALSRISALSKGRTPLLTGRGRRLAFEGDPAATWAQEVVLTDAGRRLLRSGGDWFGGSGLERWIGGVRLGPGLTAWRWSRASRRIVHAG